MTYLVARMGSIEVISMLAHQRCIVYMQTQGHLKFLFFKLDFAGLCFEGQ